MIRKVVYIFYVTSLIIVLSAIIINLNTALQVRNGENNKFENLKNYRKETAEVDNTKDSEELTQNENYFAWISIEGTNIDYPVMYKQDDSLYYLTHDFFDNESSHGVPFIAGENYPGCGNYIIYAHNMKDGTMFHELLSYKKNNFYINHPTIKFKPKNKEVEIYNIIAVFESSLDDPFAYYKYVDLTDENYYLDYLRGSLTRSLYPCNQVSPGSDLITLSTCSYHKTEGRFVVVACKAT